MSSPGGGRPGRESTAPEGAGGAARPSAPLSVLTFEVGDYLLGVPSQGVARLVPPRHPLPEGVTVVDAVGLLPRGEGRRSERRKGCHVLLAAEGPEGSRVAISASRAGDMRVIEPGRLLPLPGFLFPRENPFLGLIPGEGKAGRGRPVFVLAGPERLIACAGAR